MKTDPFCQEILFNSEEKKKEPHLVICLNPLLDTMKKHPQIEDKQVPGMYIPRKSKDQTLPHGTKESFTWIIPKTIPCLVLDYTRLYTYFYTSSNVMVNGDEGENFHCCFTCFCFVPKLTKHMSNNGEDIEDVEVKQSSIN